MVLEKEVENEIINCYMNYSYKELSKRLNVSIRTIQYIITKYDLPKKIKEKTKWTKDKLSFLRENYHLGSEYCSENLKIPKQSIRSKASELKLKRGFKTNDILLDTTNKYSCYMLGYLWADGSVFKNNHNKVTSIMISKEDYLDIKEIFDVFGDWYTKDMSKYKKKEHHKDLMLIKTTNPRIFNFLEKHDFCIKSHVSPEKILSKINNHHYFWRGFLDGDGYIKHIKDSNSYGVIFSSTFNYDWSSLETYCEKNSLNYNKYKYTQKSGKNSLFCIQRKKDMLDFLNLIYQDFFGLERKYLTYLNFRANF